MCYLDLAPREVKTQLRIRRGKYDKTYSSLNLLDFFALML